ncbi:uncharacterized protein LOC126898380 isoform X2 [Daktulosphaira vitifoliae]|uniref:uncharacterized protein LOC126898380 isoform X2 n=1 Tax=Daktulosphaira vitifoliae TaxID=58002 RepID=UPI0021AAFCEE|nr:uncharacterized protein LOC126898380 isoform X2 [Daktulosphaira vitifoliae]
MHLEYSYFVLYIVNAIGMINANDNNVKFLQSICQQPIWKQLKTLLCINENGNKVTIEEIANANLVTRETLSHKAKQMHLLLSCNSAYFFVQYSELAKCLKDKCEEIRLIEIVESCKGDLRYELKKIPEVIKNWKSQFLKLSKMSNVEKNNGIYSVSDSLINLGTLSLKGLNIDARLNDIQSTTNDFIEANCFQPEIEFKTFMDSYREQINKCNYAYELTGKLLVLMELLREYLVTFYFQLKLEPTPKLRDAYPNELIDERYERMLHPRELKMPPE